MPTEIRDYYQILQVDKSAEAEVISAAYRGLARKYHPDTCILPDATHRMQEINQAYAVLSDPQLRAQYDEALTEKRDVKVERRTHGSVVHAPEPNPVHRAAGMGVPDSKTQFDLCQVDARQLTPLSRQAFGRRFELSADIQGADDSQNVMTVVWSEGTYHSDLPDQQCRHCQSAYQKLIDELQRDGWRPAGIAGQQWFQQWFKRQRAAT